MQGNRGELFAVEVARAHAALNGNDRIESEDLQMGVRLCIAPRGTEIQAPPDDEMMGAIAIPPPTHQLTNSLCTSDPSPW